jgi:hypothetical protein
MATTVRIGARRPPKSTRARCNGGYVRTEIRPGQQLLDLALDRHNIQCPHCHEQTEHLWPGSVILLAELNCAHCGRQFLVAQNEPWLEEKRNEASQNDGRRGLRSIPCYRDQEVRTPSLQALS